MPDPVHPTHTAGPNSTSARPSTATILTRVARDRVSLLVFVIVAAAATGVYGVVLPSTAAGGRLTLGNWAYLDAPTLALSLVLGVGVAAVLTLQVYAVRQVAAQRRAAGGRTALSGIGFLGSLVPGLCCTPVLPAVLAVFGVGAGGAAATMQAITPYRTLILLGSLLVFVALAWWTARRIAGRTSAATAENPSCCSTER